MYTVMSQVAPLKHKLNWSVCVYVCVRARASVHILETLMMVGRKLPEIRAYLCIPSTCEQECWYSEVSYELLSNKDSTF